MKFTVTELTENSKPIIKKSVNVYRGIKGYLEILSDFKREKYSDIRFSSPSTLTFTCPVHGEITQTKTSFMESEQGCKKCSVLAKRYKTFKDFEKILKDKKVTVKLVFNSSFPASITFYEEGEKHTLPSGKFKKKYLPKKFRGGHGRGFIGFENIVIKSMDLYGPELTYLKEDNEGVDYGRSIMTITCSRHGKYSRMVNTHLKKGGRGGCPVCFRENQSALMLERVRIKNEKLKADGKK